MRVIVPTVSCGNMNGNKYKYYKRSAKAKEIKNTIAEETMRFAYKPIIDVLERIDTRLERVEDILSYRFVETKNGKLMQKITYEDEE